MTKPSSSENSILSSFNIFMASTLWQAREYNGDQETQESLPSPSPQWRRGTLTTGSVKGGEVQEDTGTYRMGHQLEVGIRRSFPAEMTSKLRSEG